MNIDEEIRQHDDKKKERQEENVRNLISDKLSDGEEITAYLHSDPKALRALRTLGIAGVIIGLMSFIIGLALYFRPLMFSWGSKGFMFFFWFAVGIAAVIIGVIFLCSQHFIFKRGGIVLTDKRITFYSGRFASKFTEIDLACVSDVENEISFVRIKGGGYKVAIAGHKSFYNETPFDFKSQIADVFGKNYQKKDGKNMA
ncbi:MAG: hypothetical protein ACI4QU_05205 [Christensenellales bacterium]